MALFGPPNVEKMKAKKDIKGLIKALGYQKDSNVRQAAAAALTWIGAPAVEALIEALQDENGDVRRSATIVLGQIGDARAVKPLLAEVKKGRLNFLPDGCGPVVEALAGIGPAAVSTLITALGDVEWRLRQTASVSLGRIGSSQAVEPLIAILMDKDTSVREAAGAALAQIGIPAVQNLIIELGNRDVDVRLAAARALAEIGDPQAVQPLITALKDPHQQVRQAAADALVKVGEPAVGALSVALRIENIDVGRAAAGALDRMGWRPDRGESGAWYWVVKRDWNKVSKLGATAVAPLIFALEDEEQDVRCASAEALGEIGDPQAVQPLVTALRDKTPEVRAAAAKALGQIGDPQAVNPLVAILDEDGDELARQAVAGALLKIGEPAVIPLIAALKKKPARGIAARVLGAIGDPRAVDPLIAVLRDNVFWQRQVTAEALGEIGDPRAVDPLIALLKDEHQQVRQAAADALVKVGESGVDRLIAELQDQDKNVNSAAIRALDRIGWKPDRGESGAWYWVVKRDWAKVSQLGSAAVAPLLFALHDEEQNVRCAAAKALGEIGDLKAVKPLMAALEDNFNDVRVAAAEALGKIGDLQAVQPLIAALKDKHKQARMAATGALIKIGEPAVDSLIAALRDQDQNIRSAAAGVLDQMGRKPDHGESSAWYWVIKRDWNKAIQLGSFAEAPLLFALYDENKDVRNAAAEALDKLGWEPDCGTNGAVYWIIRGQWKRCIQIGAPAVVPLIAALQDKNESVRSAAAGVLGQIGDARAVEPLISALKKDAWQAAIDALGHIGDNRAVEPLIVLLKNKDNDIRIATIEALGRIGNAQAVKPLVTTLKKEPNMRSATAAALAQIGAPAVKPLIAILEEKGGSERVLQVVSEALTQIGEHAVIPLLAALKHKHTRLVAARVLGDIGDPRAVEPLITALEDERHTVRQAAALSLGQIGDSRAKVPLSALLQDNALQVSRAAVEALDKMGWQPDQGIAGAFYWAIQKRWDRCTQIGAPAVEALIAALKTDDENDLQTVITALGQIGDARAVEPLIPLISNSNYIIRKTTAESLVTLYRSGKLDQKHERLILAKRTGITRPEVHTDEKSHFDIPRQSMDCHVDNTIHKDTISGIGVSFPV
jgi:HEAT repeat protein